MVSENSKFQAEHCKSTVLLLQSYSNHRRLVLKISLRRNISLAKELSRLYDPVSFWRIVRGRVWCELDGAKGECPQKSLNFSKSIWSWTASPFLFIMYNFQTYCLCSVVCQTWNFWYFWIFQKLNERCWIFNFNNFLFERQKTFLRFSYRNCSRILEISLGFSNLILKFCTV